MKKSGLLVAVFTWALMFGSSSSAALSYSIRDLGTLGGTQSAAFDINEQGLVAGEAFTAGDATAYAVMWDEGGITNLGTLDGGAYSRAYGINSSGQVVGYSDVTYNNQQVQRAFIWDGNNISDLGTLGGRYGEAASINDSSAIVGFSEISVSHG